MNLRTVLGSWAAPLVAHNHNQQTAMQRAAAAREMGLDPAVYGVPLPGSNVTTTTNVTGGWAKAALLGAALLAGGGVGALALTGALGKPQVSPPGHLPPAATAKGSPGFDALYEQQQPDGSWKLMKREPLIPPTP